MDSRMVLCYLLRDLTLCVLFISAFQIDHEGLEKSLVVGVEWDKETNPDNVFLIEGKIEPSVVTAAFK